MKNFEFKDDSLSDSDEDGLDAVIAELEKSIKETMQELDSSKQRMRVKEKKEKAARLHAKLERITAVERNRTPSFFGDNYL